MKNKDEINSILLDFINGKLDENEKAEIKLALESDIDLQLLYYELKNTMNIIDNVKYDRPPEYYFTNLLPRIQERIESEKSVSIFERINVYWKIILPVAVVLLIFVFYSLFTSKVNQSTKNNTNEKEIIKDTGKIKNDFIKKADDNEYSKKDSIEIPKTKVNKSSHINNEKNQIMNENSNLLTNEINTKEPVKIEIVELENNDLSMAEVLSEFEDEELETIYDESEKDYNKLSPNDKNEIINQLNKINL
jgi:hypothetical protein